MLGVILGLVVVLALFLVRGDFVQGLMRPAYNVNKCYDSDCQALTDVKKAETTLRDRQVELLRIKGKIKKRNLKWTPVMTKVALLPNRERILKVEIPEIKITDVFSIN